MEAEQEQFQQILTTLLSTENAIRTQAEEAYNALPINSKVLFLLNAVQDAAKNEEERQMAAVLLRRLFSTQFIEFFPKLPPDGQQQLKERLLMAVQTEQSDSIRRKICDIVSEMARNLIDDDGNNIWPEFLQFMFQCANAPTPVLKEAALRMFTSVPGVFGNHQSNYLDLIKQMLQQSLIDATSYPVRFQAVRAVSAFVLLHEKETAIHKHFCDLLPNMIQVVGQSLKEQDDDALLKCLIDLSESTPKFLRPQLESIIQMCMTVLTNEELEDSWRHLGLEVLVTLSETAPAMMRKEAGKYIPVLIPLVLKMMTDLDEDPEWSVSDEITEDDNDSTGETLPGKETAQS